VQTHAPALQERPPVQVVPHAPQLAGSVCTLVQVPPQETWPLVPHAQAPLAQICPVAQAMPQPPQLVTLASVSTQSAPHCVCP
jgi:hypothetical protein